MYAFVLNEGEHGVESQQHVYIVSDLKIYIE